MGNSGRVLVPVSGAASSWEVEGSISHFTIASFPVVHIREAPWLSRGSWWCFKHSSLGAGCRGTGMPEIAAEAAPTGLVQARGTEISRGMRCHGLFDSFKWTMLAVRDWPASRSWAGAQLSLRGR
jgi:hypothetical protein